MTPRERLLKQATDAYRDLNPIAFIERVDAPTDWPESPANGPLEIAIVRIKPEGKYNREDLWIFVGQPDEATCCDDCEDSPCICKSIAVPLSSINTLINALRVAQHAAKGGVA